MQRKVEGVYCCCCFVPGAWLAANSPGGRITPGFACCGGVWSLMPTIAALCLVCGAFDLAESDSGVCPYLDTNSVRARRPLVALRMMIKIKLTKISPPAPAMSPLVMGERPSTAFLGMGATGGSGATATLLRSAKFINDHWKPGDTASAGDTMFCTLPALSVIVFVIFTHLAVAVFQ